MKLLKKSRKLRRKQRKLPSIRNKVHIEPLEPRILLSGDLTYSMAAEDSKGAARHGLPF